MYSAAADTMPLASGKKIKSFFKQEIDNYLKEHNCSSFDREGLKDLITVIFLCPFYFSSCTTESNQARQPYLYCLAIVMIL